MKSSKLLALSSTLAAATLGLTASADDKDNDRYGTDRDRDIVSVAFGAGLNTAQPGNPENHHVIPPVIKVDVGDVVNFVVAGFHVIRVYDDGVRLRDVKLQLPDECEVNPLPPATFPSNCESEPPNDVVPIIPTYGLPVYYQGLNPLAPPAVPPFAQASTTVNRVESVSFLKAGRYLVICAVLPHFNDGMVAWVEVGSDRDRDGRGNDYDRRGHDYHD